MLDVHCKDIGKFFITKYLDEEQLYGLTVSDYADIFNVVGPQELVKKATVQG